MEEGGRVDFFRRSDEEYTGVRKDTNDEGGYEEQAARTPVMEEEGKGGEEGEDAVEYLEQHLLVPVEVAGGSSGVVICCPLLRSFPKER